MTEFLQSPFFNKRKDVTQLFAFLSGCKTPPSKEKTFDFLFPKAAQYDSEAMLFVMSWLLKLMEQFLAFGEWSQQKSTVALQVAAAYRKRHLGKQFDVAAKNTARILEQQPLRNADYFHTQYELQSEEYEFYSTEKRTEKLPLQKLSDTIDISFLAVKLRETCFMLSHQSVFKADYNFGLLEMILPTLHESKYLEIPAIAIYYNTYFCLTKSEEEGYFNKLKELIFLHSSEFPEREVRAIYLLAINYCIKRLNAGNEDFAKAGFELYRGAMSQNVLQMNGILSRFTFRNVVALGLKTGEFDWVSHFIQTSQSLLESNHKESMVSFSTAMLKYEQKNYSEALQLLQKAEYKDLLLNLAAKSTLLKIFYELQEFDLLDSHLEAMKNFIYRQKDIGYHKESYIHLLKITQKLSQNLINTEADKNELREQILETKNLAEKFWLLAQLKKYPTK